MTNTSIKSTKLKKKGAIGSSRDVNVTVVGGTKGPGGLVKKRTISSSSGGTLSNHKKLSSKQQTSRRGTNKNMKDTRETKEIFVII